MGRRERVFQVGLAVNHAIKNRFSITAKVSGGRYDQNEAQKFYTVRSTVLLDRASPIASNKDHKASIFTIPPSTLSTCNR